VDRYTFVWFFFRLLCRGSIRKCVFFNKQIVILYFRIENAEGYVLMGVYLFIYLYACSSHNKKSFKPNRMGNLVG